MRLAVVLLFGAACSSPEGEGTCPGDATCGPGGELIDAAIADAPTDAADPCVPATTMTSDDVIGPSATHFVGDHGSQRAVAYNLTGTISLEGNFDAGGTYVEVLPPTTESVYSRPRLAPGGEEMFVAVDTAPTKTFGRATRISPNQWSNVDNMAFYDGGTKLDPFLTGDANISAPTVTQPRRLVVSSSDGVREFVEFQGDPLVWRLVNTVGATVFGEQFLGQAMLSADGLRMTFRGNNQTGNTTAFIVTRGDLAESFLGVAVELPHDASLSVETPFLSANCKHLYYTAMPAGVVHHVLLP